VKAPPAAARSTLIANRPVLDEDTLTLYATIVPLTGDATLAPGSPSGRLASVAVPPKLPDGDAVRGLPTVTVAA